MQSFFVITDFDSSVVKVTIYPVEPDWHDMTEYVNSLDQLYASLQRQVVIFDLSKSRLISQEFRSRINEVTHKNAENIKVNCLGMAFISQSPLTKFILSELLSAGQLDIPQQIFDEEIEGYVWAQSLLKRHSVSNDI